MDGLSDLIQNTNDIEESSRKISLLMKLAEEHNVHICSAVHTNPSSEKTRGHVGSEVSYSDLCQKIMAKESVVERTAKRRISQAVEFGVLKKTEEGSYSLCKI